jgi:hypothetical protein
LAEQIARGVTYLQKTYEKLGGIEEKLGIIGKGVELSNQRLEKLGQFSDATSFRRRRYHCQK